ncbi:MAG TPA: glycosyltransferase [Candidatus Acidoferrales bacterium]|nr:glycosyltransferase [Candidatus Acidoferrales bacterium]
MNERLAITHLVLSLDVGGLERMVIDLARQQRTAGHDARICCLWRKGTLAPQAEEFGVPVYAFEKTPGFSPGVAWRIADQLRTSRVEVLHTHNAPVHHYGVAAAVLARVPVIVNTEHGQHGWDASKNDQRLNRLFRSSLRWTGAVAMVSDETRQYHLANGGFPGKKCRVILNGIPVDRFASRRATPGSRLPSLRFGTVARLAPVKDHITMVEAFARVAAQCPAAELHIAGDGEMRPRIVERIAALRLDPSVHLHGAVHDIPGFLSTLDVFVMSSLSEGLPVALLEAMASGLPSVSTRVGGIPEVAPENEVAFYGPPHDSKALAAQMLRMANADLAAMGAAANAIVRRRYGIDRTADKYEQVYRELLGRGLARRFVA